MTKPYRIVCDKDVPRSEWLKIRQDYVGASETSLTDSLLERKISETGEIDTDIFWWGHELEPLIIRFAKRKGFCVMGSQNMLQSTLYPEMACTLDGVCRMPRTDWRRDKMYDFLVDQGWMPKHIDEAMSDDRLSVFEIKTADKKYLDQWSGDEPPRAYWVQCQSQMAVTGFEVAWLVCLVGGRYFRAFRITRDEEFIKQRADDCRKFMQRVEAWRDDRR